MTADFSIGLAFGLTEMTFVAPDDVFSVIGPTMSSSGGGSTVGATATGRKAAGHASMFNRLNR